jgi:putative transposase
VNQCKLRDVSLSRACSLVGLNRSLYYYHLSKPRIDSDSKLILRIQAIREKHQNVGGKKIAKMLSSESERINHKRIARILQEQGLTVCRRKRRRRMSNKVDRIPIPKNVTQSNRIWSIDFMCARKTNSFKFMLFNIIDIGSRISPAMTVERSFTSFDVTDELERAIEKSGRPSGLITDNGKEFTSTHFKIWCRRNNIVHHLTNKGSPAENCFVESFNSSVRREVLDLHVFETMNELRKRIDEWRSYYNSVRPHGSLNYQTPENYNNLIKTMEIAV